MLAGCLTVARRGRLDKNPCWHSKLAQPGADLGPSAEVQTGPGSWSSARDRPPGQPN